MGFRPVVSAAILLAGFAAGGRACGADVPITKGGDWEVTVSLGAAQGERVTEDPGGGEGGKEKVEVAPPETTLRLRATVLEFGSEGIKIRPEVAPDREIEFKTSQLLGINRIPEVAAKAEAGKPVKKEEKEEPDPADFVVTLKDGGEFTGKLATFDGSTTVLESAAFGPMKIPTQAVRSIARNDDRFAEPKLPESVEEAVAELDTGEVFKGTIATDADDPSFLVMSGAVMQARFPLKAVCRIDLPAGSDRGREAVARKEFEVVLTDGGRLVGDRVDLEGDAIGIAMHSGLDIDLPLSRIESIYLVESGGSSLGSGVVMWGGYSDPAEEYVRTRASAEGSGLRIDEITEQVPGTDLRRRLFRSRAFLVPEMEQLNPGMLDTEVESGGRKMKLRDYFNGVMRPELEKFTAAGGHVVFTGIQGNHFEVMKLLGFDEVRNATDQDGSEFKIAPEIRRKLRMDNDKLVPANATHCYDTPDGWVAFAGQEGKKAAAAISKSLRRGRVTLIGADFYESNASIDELLQKVLRLTK